MTKSHEGIAMNKSRAFLCALAAIDHCGPTEPVTASSVLDARMITEGIHTGWMGEGIHTGWMDIVAAGSTYSAEEQ